MVLPLLHNSVNLLKFKLLSFTLLARSLFLLECAWDCDWECFLGMVLVYCGMTFSACLRFQGFSSTNLRDMNDQVAALLYCGL